MGSGKNFYNSKFKNQKQKTFQGGDRFSTSTKIFIKVNRVLDLQTILFPTRSNLMEDAFCQI